MNIYTSIICTAVFVLLGWKYNFDSQLLKQHQAPPPCTIPVGANKPLQTSVRPIFFVHFHKSGGSSVCRIMQRQSRVNLTDPSNRLRTDLVWNNCNAAFGGFRERVDYYDTLQTCRQLETYTMDDAGIPFRRNNFVPIEVPFHDRMPCAPDKWRTFAIMRHPVERAVSNVAFHAQTEKDVMEWLSNKTIFPKRYLPHGYPVFNSIVIRQLLGRERFIDTRPVNQADLEQAQRQVDLFDAFIPLEYLMDSNILSLLNSTFPEYHDELLRYPVKANKNRANRTFDKAFLQRLEEENYYDLQLYQYVLKKHGLKES